MTPPQLIPNGVPLSSVPGLTAAQIKTLSDSWITTAQEMVALASANEALRNRLADALAVDPPTLDGIVQAAQKLIPETRDLRSIELESRAAQTRYSLGARLDEPAEVMEQRLNLPPYTPLAARAVLPSTYSLLDELPPVRNQGSRSTCVAHAAAAVREQLEIAVGSTPDIDLSEQYIYWWCKGHDGIPKAPGTYVATGMRCLNETGAPSEAAWPYTGWETGDEGQGPPPALAARGDLAFRTLRTQEFNRRDITGIKTCLSEGRAVAFSVPVFDSWYSSSATSRWGKITLPLAGEKEDGGHAMTLVGFQDDPDAPGGGYFLVRNSWQPWAWAGVWQEGYGYIPYTYITRHATAVFSAVRIASARIYLRDSAGEARPRVPTGLSWNSPDIWLRRVADGGIEPQTPVPGQANALYVRATNLGQAYAYKVRADVFWAPAAPYVRPADWQPAGQLQARWLKPGETVLGPLAWTPPGTGPYALLARLSSVDDAPGDVFDPAVDDKIAQRNLWQVGTAPGGTVGFAFDLVGVSGKSGAVSLLVNRGDLPPDAVVWPISIGPARDQAEESRGIVDSVITGALTGGVVLGLGERRQASLSVTVPPDVAHGASFTLSVVQNQGTEIAGRLTVRVEVA